MKEEGIKVLQIEEGMLLEKQIPITTASELLLGIRKAIAELLNKHIENVPLQEIKHALFLAYWWLRYGKKGFEDSELQRAYYRFQKQEPMLISAIEQLLARRESFYFLYSTYVTTSIIDVSRPAEEEPFIGTAIDYKTLKVDIVFEEEDEGEGEEEMRREARKREAIVKIRVAMLRDYQGPNVGRIIIQ